MKVFVSYSYEDAKFKDELLAELALLNRLGGITFWHDGLIRHGGLWKDAINEELRQADAAILLISNTFLASDFCQDQEVPQLLNRHKDEGIRILPIIVQPCNWGLYEWLRNFQLRPKNKKGEVIPLASLGQVKKKEFYSALCEEIYKSLAQSATRITGLGHQLVTEEKREQYAKSLASTYPARKDETLKELVKSYIWLYQKGIDKPAFALVQVFEREVSAKRFIVTDPLHLEILNLLKAGLPVEPVHLKDLSTLTVESLFLNPGYAALMHGIRLTESDYSTAITHLDKVSKENNNLASCPLILYALGQSHRKLGHLDAAIGKYNWALTRINTWKNEYCDCGPMCPKDGLLVESHRGLGTVFRRKENWEKADEHFKKGEEYLTDHVSVSIRSDFLYSYGYYVFERAYKSFKFAKIDETQYKKRLDKAKELFEWSKNLLPKWDAPRARLQIVNQLLGNIDLDEYLTARNCAISEGSRESRLTAINCGFAILVGSFKNAPTSRPTIDFDSHNIYEELEKVFQDILVPAGPRACHAFDNEVILGSQDLEADIGLYRVNALFQESATWKYKTLDEQVKLLEDFRRRSLF